MAVEFKGAEVRAQNQRALAYQAAFLPYQKQAPSFEKFVGIKQTREAYVRDFQARWDRVDAALNRSAT